ncbi:MAG: DUF58 domain-containing protein [Gammaproteobacteria bacterium]|nr:MAG: DUF58 domain-containing protein [Gammaproteobacteria bacterium]
MSALPPTPEAVLRHLEWTVLRRLDGLLHGSYRTLFRGAGLDLADVREYQPHDDVRHIDWNVTARLQSLHVRQYMEDREVVTWFLLDLSPSVDFGTDASKRDILNHFVAVLARVLTRHGNPVGAIIYGAGIEAVIAPRTGRRHVLHFLHALMSRPGLPKAPRTDLGELLRAAIRIMPRRSLVFLVSDFISTPGWAQPLAQLSRRHEVVAVRLYDPAEVELPAFGMTVVQDAETGEQMFVDSGDRGFRRRFAEAAGRREAQIMTALATAGVDALELSTGDDLMETLLRFAALRKRRGLSTVGLARHLERPA